MRFALVILKNLLRRPTRSLLTIIGVAVGIGAVVALTGVAGGFERTWEQAYSARGTDLGVTKITSQSPVPTTFPGEVVEKMRQMPGVADAVGVLSDFMGIEESPGLLVFGWPPGTFLWDHLRLTSGSWPKPGERTVALGTVAAELLHKQVGATIQIELDDFTVGAIFESPAMVENAAVIMPLHEMQRATGREDRVNFINVKVTDGGGDEVSLAVQKRIRETMPGFNAFRAGELARSNSGVQIAKAMSWATSIIALVVGAIGVMNTVSMSVFERFREFGVLLAIGWRRGRILAMVLLESLLVSLIGGVLGIGLGTVAVKVMETTDIMRGKLQGDITPELCGTAMLIALGLGLLGGLYPAWRGSRLEPSAAMRSE